MTSTKLDKSQTPVAPARSEAKAIAPTAAPATAAAPATQAPAAKAPAQAKASDLFGALPAPKVPNRLMGLIAQPEAIRARGPSNWVAISSHDDDPFVNKSVLEKLSKSFFTLGPDGKPTGLVGPRVKIEDEQFIYRQNDKGQFLPFANNPWPAAKPNSKGNFVFDHETRFPLHLIERDKDGKPVLDENGLQIWKPRELFLGQTTAFEAVNTTTATMEQWAGRHLPTGTNGDGQIVVNTHAFIAFNAFYSGGDKNLYFGVVPYRMPGETDIKMFEMASSWEVASHEMGHALHHELKPNVDGGDVGFRQWGESFGDQAAMFVALTDRDRARELLREVKGDFNKTNSMTRIGEVFASLVGEGTGIRDAFQNKTVANTTEEVHDRSEVLTGAAYKVFQRVYTDLRGQGMKELDAVQKAGQIMGTMMAKVSDHTPENTMSFEDVAKAYVKADKEYFGGRYGAIWTEQFTKRGVFDADSLKEIEAHEAGIPALKATSSDPAAMKQLVRDNLAALGIPAGFSLDVQSHQVDADGRQVVRVQLTDASGQLQNHGVLVFRPDGSLGDYQSPIPAGLGGDEATKLLADARAAGLDQKGALGLRAKEAKDGGGFTVQVTETVKAEGKFDSHLMVYSLEQPEGVRRDFAHMERNNDHLKELLPKGAVLVDPKELGL